MIRFICLLLITSEALAAPPTPFPVFLKMGFSSVLDFDEAPTRVVLGDGQLFQVERLEHSLVVRAVAPYAISNMFVYFRNESPRMFVLTASEDAEPTYYKSFITQIQKATQHTDGSETHFALNTGSRLLSARFDPKKDYLVVDFVITANAKEPLKPKWDWIRITYNHSAITPDKLWSERKEVQRDSAVRVRLILTKPNVPRTLTDVGLVIPLQGHPEPIHINLGRSTH